MTQTVVVTGSFDDLRSRQVRFLEEASRFGEVTVLLWGDDLVRQRAGKPPKFAQAEREYFLRAIRFVRHVRVITDWSDADALPEVPDFQPGIWVVDQRDDNPAKRTYCQNHAVHFSHLSNRMVSGNHRG